MNWYGNRLSQAWDSKTTKALTSAYQDALTRAKELGFCSSNSDDLSNMIASNILHSARHGTYDPHLLAERAIQYLQNRKI